MLLRKRESVVSQVNRNGTLELWLDPTDQGTITETTGVSSVLDKSDNRRSAVQATEANRPVNGGLINTRNVLDYTTNDYLSVSSFTSILSRTSNWTVFIVFQLDTDSISAKTLLGSSISGSDRTIMQIDNQRLIGATYNGSAWNYKEESFTDTTSPHVMTVTNTSAGTLTPYLDGVALTSMTETPASSATVNTTIGARSDGGSNWEGLIGEVIIFSEVLSADDRARIESELITNYGV